MRKFIVTALLLLFCGSVYAQGTTNAPKPDTQVEKIVNLHSPESEALAAINFLESIAHEDRVYIQLFSTYTIPEESIKVNEQDVTLVDATVLVFRFWIHSMSSAFNYVQPIKVSNTLWAIDIRNYGWTPEAMERVGELDPYFREPWVTHATAAKLRLLARNSVLRMDWFLAHSTTNTRQLDKGINIFPYYELLYARHGVPNTAQEMRKIWGFNEAEAIEFRVLSGNIIDDSTVALHNRQINRARTSTGYWWETNDVKDMIGGKDYIENLDPSIRKEHKDAGEIIATNYIGLQVYALIDGQENRVEFADNAIAVDGTDSRDKRVRTAKSCVICHPKGINHASNDLVKILGSANLKVENLVDRNILDSYFVNNDLTELINDDQELYARAVNRANGLEPEVNARLFEYVLNWYDKPVDQKQAALEWGVSVDVLKQKLAPTTSARLLGLINDIPVTRSTWEEVKGGIFANGMLLIHGLKPVETEPEEVIKEVQEQEESIAPPVNDTATVLESGARIMDGPEEVGIIPAGTTIEILEERPSWYKVKHEGINGWILADSVEKN